MRASAPFALFSLFVCLACSPVVEIAQALQVQDVTTGWFDDGVHNGQNRLIPSISYKLKNVSAQNLPVLQTQVIFRRVTEKQTEWGTGFSTVTGSEGLAPGATTKALVLRSTVGYTGSSESREEMLKNSHFVDAEVEVQAKYGSSTWAVIGRYPVARQLVTKSD